MGDIINAPHKAQATIERYGEERAKRLRDDGQAQYIDISLSANHEKFGQDPWAKPATFKPLVDEFPNRRCDILIVGAGWGGLLHAVRMVKQGIAPDSIRIIDTAGGFGGTWYFNRYPGLTCDIESYSYLPLLEETGYVPENRYASGEEIRRYAELVAQKWGVADSAVFQTKAKKLAWHEDAKEWEVELTNMRPGESPQELTIRSRIVVLANGVLHWPKLPGIPGLLEYQGDIFHSSRWVYDITGGSPSDPKLEKLQDKRVAIIGTGATSIQIIPNLARWSKHLFVFQRTPAAVDYRGQKETDSDWFRNQAPGWQRERISNFHQHFTLGDPPTANLVDDEWTRAPALVGIAGNMEGPKSLEEIEAYAAKVAEIDMPRQERIRRRIDDTVGDPETAAKLKPWYPSWCKRPVFHDEYLDNFNRDNVTLVDTDGKGPERVTADSIVVEGEHYPVDVVILATGFRSHVAGTPAEKGNMTISGRDGVSMSEVWAQDGPATLHGVLDARFPNLFLSGPIQAGLSGNFSFSLDTMAKHCAYIIAQAMSQANGKPFAVKTTEEAAEAWATQVMMRSPSMALVFGCTPGYFNLEGDIDRIPMESRGKMARHSIWGSGIEDFVSTLEAWREEGSLAGVDIAV
ncbi:hypothetical protein NW762_014017 [Fusarium torreyae]|uniref:FAD/NAD(P)-binding domain-containing protein n=1 Tax=Fusarium torreyae TaxID=1237075 RepID=A0A9W8RKW4_9HYPO|nr:hypothetical protein NW762_014017 [Fusarium torreyae]